MRSSVGPARIVQCGQNVPPNGEDCAARARAHGTREDSKRLLAHLTYARLFPPLLREGVAAESKFVPLGSSQSP
jgi:hypothetical protein